MAVGLVACADNSTEDKGSGSSEEQTATLQVVATSTMLRDLAEQIGKDKATVTGIMAPGVDPHL